MTQLRTTVDIWDIAQEILVPNQYRILELRERHGFSWNQIAAMTNRDQATVRGAYYRAVRNVHNALDEREA